MAGLEDDDAAAAGLGGYRKQVHNGEVGKDFRTGAGQYAGPTEGETVGFDYRTILRHDDHLDPAPSRTPRSLRVGTSWGEIVTRVKAGEFTWEEFVETLDMEELGSGRIRDASGRLLRIPAYVPRDFLTACHAEILRRGSGAWKGHFEAAVGALASIVTSASAKDADKIKAATYIIERVAGKTPDKVDVTVREDPWQVALQGMIYEGELEEDAAISRAHDYTARTAEGPEESA